MSILISMIMINYSIVEPLLVGSNRSDGLLDFGPILFGQMILQDIYSLVIITVIGIEISTNGTNCINNSWIVSIFIFLFANFAMYQAIFLQKPNEENIHGLYTNLNTGNYDFKKLCWQ